MKKTMATLILAALLTMPTFAASSVPPDISAPFAILVEAKTGKVLYGKNVDERLPPTSVTKK